MSYSRQPVRIWDLPTRLFHWAFAACIVGAYACVKLGGLYMDWHVRLGLTALGLLIFRLIWGFVGPRHARFASFIHGPRVIRNYLRGSALYAGHNPLGALSVMAMLLLFGAQIISGLFVTDDIMVQGPLYGTVDEAISRPMSWLHHRTEWYMVALVVLHLLAIAWYALIKRRPLVHAMISGNMPPQHVPERTTPSEDNFAIWLRAAIVAALAYGIVWWINAQETAAFY